MRIFQILLLVSGLTLSSCLTDEYDLSNGLNTDITLGGDSLTFPIGKTDSIFLGNMLSGQSIDLLEKSDSGTYALNYQASTQVKLDAIDPVSFNIDPITITPITSSFAEIKFPSFQFTPISIESNLPIPDLSVGGKAITPINSNFTMSKAITVPSPTKRLVNTNLSTPSKSKLVSYVIGPVSLTDNKSLEQSLHITFPPELKKVKKIYLKNNRVTLSFDKTAVNNMGFTSQNDTIKSFQIDFPSEFRLTSPTGLGTKITGSSFIIEDAILTTANVYTASFLIERLNMDDVSQNGSLDYVKTIPYSIDYSFSGVIDAANLPSNPKLEVGVSLTAAAEIDDMDIETNPFSVIVQGNNSPINKTIDNIPEDILEVNTLTFEDGASLDLDIVNPGISPFQFVGGNCEITLPQSLIFKAYSGLNNTTNILTIPYSDLFGSKSIGISGMKLNKTVTNQQITVSDALSYTITGLTVGSQVASLNTLQTINNKKLSVTGNINGLSVKDASMTTKSISLEIPNIDKNIDISKFVSTDVKKIYSVTLKTPSQLKFKINIKNLPPSIDSIFLKNYTIKLPTALRFKSGDVNSNNEVVLNRGFKVSEGLTKTLTLEMFDFGTTGNILNNGTFNFNEAVTMTGGAYIKGTNLNSSEIGTVEISPTIEIGTMDLALIEGKLNPVIESISKSIPLDLPEMFKNDSNNLDIKNPVISLEIGNSMGIPVDVVLNLVPMSKGAIIPNATIISPTIHIAAASVLGQTTMSKFRISKSFEVYPDGFTSIAIPNLPNLLKVIPDSILINVNSNVTGERHYVDLYSPKNQLDLNYSVNVPLDFGQDFRFQFNDTVPDLKSKLKDLLDLTQDIEIVAVVESKIPMNLAFTIAPLDSINQRIEGITVKADSIKYNNTEPVSFGLKETVPGSLKKLDKFIITISATKNPALQMIPLKAEQFIIIELRVIIPKGITIEMDKNTNNNN